MRVRCAGVAAVLALAAPMCAAQPAPSFAELEEAGAIVGSVHINPRNVFDGDQRAESNALFRLANKLHTVTRPQVIERDVLFKPGDRVSVRIIDETERLLRRNRFLREVEIRPVNYRDGVVDIEVVTRDTWSIDPGASVSRSGGANSSRVSLKEYNLLGSGVSVGVAYAYNADRPGTEITVSDDHLFGNRSAISYSYAAYDVGGKQTFSFGRPFYALDTPWAAGVSGSWSDAITTVYDRGIAVAQYLAKVDQAEAYAGVSSGRVGHWTQRWSGGVSSQANTYSIQPGLVPPAQLPEDLVLAGPFARYELIEDVYEKVRNRDQIGRTEFFDLGWRASVQAGVALGSFGSTQDALVYSADLKKGLRLFDRHTVIASASVSARMHENHRENQLISASARYFIPQAEWAQVMVSAALDLYRHPDLPAPLQLGGDNGLRGYPLSYQSGERRALVTVEQRMYSDWYPFRLFRVGGAVFADAGRAWQGAGHSATSDKVLTDAGFGLRLQSTRSAFGNVAHIDFAFPLNNRSEVRSVQFLLTTKATF